MDRYEIRGGRPLQGEVTVSGAKNAVLPILAAAVMIEGTTVLEHCPDLADVRNMCGILEHLGCCVERQGEQLWIDARNVRCCSIPEMMMKQLRSSVFLAGPLLARCHQAALSSPGGCAIGERPIDLHFLGLTSLGAKIRERNGRLFCFAAPLKGTNIELSYPSVGATENIMMAAALAEGVTILRNAAREPEIADLERFLNSCGAKICGAGTPEIRIEGVKKLHPCTYRIMGDRIEGVTYLMAAAITGGTVTVRGLEPAWIGAEMEVLSRMDCGFTTGVERGTPYISLCSPARLKSPGMVKAEPWPGFSTDLQSPLMALCTKAEGVSVIEDTVFERRFGCADGLRKLGAEIRIDGRKAYITGTSEKRFSEGKTVVAGDLRGGAALVLKALENRGLVIVENICHIDRGYGKFDIVLKELGAHVEKRIGHGRKTTGISEEQTKKEKKKEEALSPEVHDFGGAGDGALFSADIASV